MVVPLLVIFNYPIRFAVALVSDPAYRYSLLSRDVGNLVLPFGICSFIAIAMLVLEIALNS